MKTKLFSFIGILSLCLAVFHLYAGGVKLFPAIQQRSIHLGLALAIIFLLYPWFKKKNENEIDDGKSKINYFINGLFGLVSLGMGGYIASRYLDLQLEITAPTTITIIVGACMIVLTIEATRRVMGLALPIIASIFLLYAFFGEHLPLMLQHSGLSFDRIVTEIGLSNQGILGTALGVSANYIILFVIFGALLERSGAGNLFMDLAMALVGRFRGGPAKVSVVSSALFGSISGSQVANVVTTGVLTIPLMKRGGFQSRFAGAVESVASTGGIFLPPVMGAVAFLVAEFLQIDYAQVALAAIIPALLYFVAVFSIIDLKAAKMGVSTVEEPKTNNVKKLLLEKGHLMLPLFVLIFLLLVVQYSANMAAFWSIVSVPIVSLLRKETRMNIKDIVEALQSGVKLSLVVVTACASAGIVVGVIEMTGMGLRFSGMLIDLAGGSLFLLCVLTMIATIIMGMGTPPIAAYLVLSILAAPALVEFGVHPLAAHLFIFYFGTLSGITPPVALAAFAAAGIAKAPPYKVALSACKLALIAFIIPFLFVYGPSLILEGSVPSIIIATASALIGVLSLAVALEGFLKTKISVYSRILMLIGSLLLLHVSWMTDALGLGIVFILTILELRKNNISPKNMQKSYVS